MRLNDEQREEFTRLYPLAMSRAMRHSCRSYLGEAVRDAATDALCNVVARYDPSHHRRPIEAILNVAVDNRICDAVRRERLRRERLPLWSRSAAVRDEGPDHVDNCDTVAALLDHATPAEQRAMRVVMAGGVRRDDPAYRRYHAALFRYKERRIAWVT